MKSFWDHFKLPGLIFVILSLLAAGIAGCASGGSSYTNPVENGEVVVSLTDAAGDFSSYTVDVVSLSLEKANGAVVETLPLSTRIDFSEYTEMTEFLTAATVPSGTYVSATMTLDFQDADIRVEDEYGDIIPIQNIVDENGDPVMTLDVSVRLEDQNILRIQPGIPAHLMLDFDLQASNQVDFEGPGAPVLTVYPFIVADVNRTYPDKIHRIRGLLDEVNLGGNTFSVILRPFYCALADTHRLYGTRPVTVNEDTIYHINGEAYEGYDGLAALAGLNRWTPVAALGSLKFNPLRFEAWEVYAGTSVPGSGLDAVSGWVVERSGDTLTVKGASLIRSGSTFVFNDRVTVQIGDNTTVTRQVSSAAYSKNDISIGQHVTAFGTLTNLDPLNLEMDATNGFVRMMITTIRGTVVAVDPMNPNAQMVIDLQSIGKYRVGIFDFAGTGISGDLDADPGNYEIDTGTMDLSGVEADTPVKLKGFAAPFGEAPPDFSAVTIIDVTDLTASLKVNWMPATGMPFTDLSADSLTVNLEGTGRLHYLVRGCVVTDLYDLQAAPVLVPVGEGIQGLFVLKHDGVTEIHTSFATFVQNLEGLLEEGYAARQAGATGRFDDVTSVMTVRFMEIHLVAAL